MKVYGEFDLEDVHVKAMAPESSDEPLQFEVTFTRGGEELKKIIVPMLYEPKFGYDVGDLAAMEDGVNTALKELGYDPGEGELASV